MHKNPTSKRVKFAWLMEHHLRRERREERADIIVRLEQLSKAVIFLDRTQIHKFAKKLWEQFPLDGVFCIFVVFRVILLARGQHKCAKNTQVRK
jgi:hypothetical protein